MADRTHVELRESDENELTKKFICTNLSVSQSHSFALT